MGRFTQPDTIVPEPGNPQSLNRYTYSLNNPLRYTNPTGYDPRDVLDLFVGIGRQISYNNAFLPEAREALAAKQDETPAMATGRHLGNMITMGQAVVEIVGGSGIDVGGGGLCLTIGGCVIGGPAIGIGTVIAVHGAAVGTIAGEIGLMRQLKLAAGILDY